MERELLLRGIFLGISGAALIFLDPLLWIAWLVAVSGMVYARRTGEGAVLELCLGVPCVVAAGYLAPILSGILMFLLIASTCGSDLFLTGDWYLSLALLITGLLLILLVLPIMDPFIAALIVIAGSGVGGGSIYLYEYSLHRWVRGEHT
ncbi:hypothetical protein FTO68_01880 [Methanocalculus taiwanensis]|uniref:Uncharacterized protein n=1 Tax=Methanocalculus taiwanensis TaxID=106207 RepID=A0ABD4TJQ1_9EURY|nr:hypothetical protein [Methanocalculus taiwanensis]MCQ1537742.1 hypothetical protein [Methanocalculus taiwanensis]